MPPTKSESTPSDVCLKSGAKPAQKVASLPLSPGTAALKCLSAEKRMKEVPNLVSQMLCEFLAVGRVDKDAPVLNLQDPLAIQNAFKDIGASLELGVDAKCITQDTILAACSQVMQLSVNTSHTWFFNQLFSKTDPVSIAADWMISALNTSMYTYEVAPVFTLIEQEVCTKLVSLITGSNPTAIKEWSNFDSIFAPGGTISNIYSMHCARYYQDNTVRDRGNYDAPQLVAFTSAQSHYSIKKAAMLMGIGLDNVISVACDNEGKMLIDALEEAIATARASGKTPFYVNATAGTTVLGAFDKFYDISKICRQEGIWMHVDAAWGAGALLSNNTRIDMAGSELADSMTWNPHKFMGVPLQCCAFLTKHKNILQNCNGLKASYLFQEDKMNSHLDTGDKAIQCGRHVDSFKLWLSWKAYGDEYYSSKVDNAYALAKYAVTKINSDSRFRLAYTASYTNVCFWYIPVELRAECGQNDVDSDTDTIFTSLTASQDAQDKLHLVAPLIKDRLQRIGASMIGFQRVEPHSPNCFRWVFINPTVTPTDIDNILDTMDSVYINATTNTD
jgi:glutamate/tyrosine decarboxylase-like PLP-dependent enzyme